VSTSDLPQPSFAVPTTAVPTTAVPTTAVAVLATITGAHLLNDLMQSVVVGVYPLLKESYHLSFTQIGLLTLVNLVTASILQPIIGWATDLRPVRFALSGGMAVMFVAILLLAFAHDFTVLLIAAALVGVGSSIFHPEASRIARLASGGRHGLAQSMFQVGGNLGSSLGPLAAALIILPRGQTSIAWFALAAAIGVGVLAGVGVWYGRHRLTRGGATHAGPVIAEGLSRQRVIGALAVLALLVFSKYVYLASLTSYYPFYLIERFQLSTQAAQLNLFVFLFAVALGTILGGPLGDRLGRKRIIWASILGVAPFTLALPHCGLFATQILTVVIGFVLASAFSAILVFAQELIPGRVGMISGLFFGFAFGVAGLGAAALGVLADHYGLTLVYQICAFLPLIGTLTVFLPDLRPARS